MKSLKKVYMSEIEGLNRRNRLLGRSKDKVKEPMNERGTVVGRVLNRVCG